MALDTPRMSKPSKAKSVVPKSAKPVLVIASRESGGSFLSALLGGHPEFYGAPHLNVLAFDELWQLIEYARVPRDSNIHGLVRFLAQQLVGEQSVQAVQAAHRWLGRRSKAGTAKVHAELRALVSPCRLVDYSPLVAQNGAAIERALAAVPDAHVIHLSRDPMAQGKAMCRPIWQTVMTSLDYWDKRGYLQPCMDLYEVGEQWVDWSSFPPVFDPQFAWYRTQSAARSALSNLSADRAIHIRLDEMLAAPEAVLTGLLKRLGADAAPATVEAMMDAGLGVYSRPGPYTAPFGVDFEMLETPVSEVFSNEALTPSRPLERKPLPWRGDGEGLLDEVVALARELGYGQTA